MNRLPGQVGLFSKKADVQELTAKRDFAGLAKALSGDLREQAAAAIAELDDVAAVGPLLNANWNGKPNDDRQAIEDAIVALGDKAVPPLVEAMTAEPMKATETALVLARFGEAAVLEPLVALSGDEAATKAGTNAAFVQQGAYAGLVRLGTPAAIDAVVRGFEEGPNHTAAALAIQSEWKGDDGIVVRALFARARLVYEFEAKVKEEIASGRASPQDAQLHADRAAEAANDPRLDDRIVEAALDALSDVPLRIRAGSVPGTEMKAICVEALRDPHPKVRGFAAGMLGDMFTKDAPPDGEVSGAIAALLDDESEYARGFAAGALAAWGDARAKDALVALLDAEDEKVAVRAATTLGELGDKSALPELEKRVKVSTSDRNVAIGKAQRKLIRQRD